MAAARAETAGGQPPDLCDVAVVGGGIIGLAVARELIRRRPRASLCVFEREPTVGSHQTGRSSGVVHAGIYYEPGSLKARLCVAGAAAMSPHGLVQELLNRSEERLWAFVSNGLALRILRDNSSLTRQAFVEFDLEGMLDGVVYTDFVLLWMLCHQSRIEAEKP